ncbi:response regulator [Stenotrophomonas indicatrix]|uniref:hybrid sensor histidine kinase/response regulator n=1 Tax=Stenotrophomonas indicatrix TaxID=2045451 RepID=UPI001EE54A37|nr:hybrid sensor histidine kinase/response regulator [Stenotrophomonas indicatrix]
MRSSPTEPAMPAEGSLGSGDPHHLVDLRRMRRRLLYGGGLLLTLLIVVATVFSAATSIRDFHADQQRAFMEGQAAVDAFLFQRDRAYAGSINANDEMWISRRPLLALAGQPLLERFRAQQDTLVITARSSDAVPWLVLGLPGKQMADSELAAHLGMLQEYSAFTNATVTWQEGRAEEAIYAYEPQGRLLAVAGMGDEARLLKILGVTSREQAFARLLEEETAARQSAPRPGPVRSASDGGRLLSRFDRNPLTGEASLVGIMTLAEGSTPYFRRVVFEPVDNIRNRLINSQQGEFVLVTADEQVVFSTGDLPASEIEGFKRWAAGLQGITSERSFSLGQYLIGGPLKGANWRLVHVYHWRDVWAAKGRALTWHAIAALGIVGLLWWVMLGMDRRLFAPALADVSRVYESQMLSRAIIDTSPVGLALVAVETGQPLLQNVLARQMAEAGGDTVPGLYARLVQWASESGKGPYVLPWPQQSAEGGQRQLEAGIARATYHDQPVWVCALRDITTQAELQDRLQQARRDSERARDMAEAASHAKSAFVAHMSHEIRTPLNGVLGHLELLARSHLQPAQRERLSRIRQSADTLMGIISDVLDFSKIEAGQLDVDPVPFTLRPLIEQAALLYSPEAVRKGLKLYCQVQAPSTAEYIADVHRIRQILNNLLSNAVKFTESGRVLVRASIIEEDGQGDELQLQVVDSGIGLAPEQLEQLFQPFQQADASISKRYGGSGLGLALCHQLAQVLGGQVSAASTQGVGSVFTLRVPVLPGTQAETSRPLQGQRITVLSAAAEWREEFSRLLQEWGAQPIVIERPGSFNEESPVEMLLVVGERRAWEAEDEAALLAAHARRVRAYAGGPLSPELRDDDVHVSCFASSALLDALLQLRSEGAAFEAPDEPPAPAGATPATQGRVLLVEDNPVNSELIQQQLEELGYQVDAADNGLLALKLWQPGLYQLVLTDINMPVMDGYEFARALRGRGEKIPILAVTATALASERQRCRQAGIDDLLLKPMDLRRLAAALKCYTQAAPTPAALSAEPAPPASTPRKQHPERLVKVFVRSLGDDLHVLANAHEGGDARLFLERVHAIKGALLMMGERALGERCGAIERQLLQQQVPAPEQVGVLLQDLHATIERYRLQLTQGGVDG